MKLKVSRIEILISTNSKEFHLGIPEILYKEFLGINLDYSILKLQEVDIIDFIVYLKEVRKDKTSYKVAIALEELLSRQIKLDFLD